MSLLYLIRHARVQMMGDAPRRWALSEEGEREAGILARQDFWRDVEHIFSSPALKARRTAEPAARRWDIPLTVADCLRELGRSRLVYDYEEVITRVFAEPEASIAGVEPAARATARITSCIQDLVGACPGQVAVVSHGLVLTLFLAQLENRWPTLAEWRAVPFAGLTILDTVEWRIVKGWSNASEIS